MYIDTMEKNNPSVDLDFNISTDKETREVHIKFTGFEDEEQLKQFAEYITNHLPLLLYNSDVAH